MAGHKLSSPSLGTTNVTAAADYVADVHSVKEAFCSESATEYSVERFLNSTCL